MHTVESRLIDMNGVKLVSCEGFATAHRHFPTDTRDAQSVFMISHNSDSCAAIFEKEIIEDVTQAVEDDEFLLKLKGGDDRATFPGFVGCHACDDGSFRAMVHQDKAHAIVFTTCSEPNNVDGFRLKLVGASDPDTNNMFQTCDHYLSCRHFEGAARDASSSYMTVQRLVENASIFEERRGAVQAVPANMFFATGLSAFEQHRWELDVYGFTILDAVLSPAEVTELRQALIEQEATVGRDHKHQTPGV